MPIEGAIVLHALIVDFDGNKEVGLFKEHNHAMIAGEGVSVIARFNDSMISWDVASIRLSDTDLANLDLLHNPSPEEPE